MVEKSKCLSARVYPRTKALAFLLLVVLSISSASGDEIQTSLRGHLAWQIALEKLGLSPGIIDGVIGPKTRLATREFPRVRGLGFAGNYYLDAQASVLWQCHSPRHPADEEQYSMCLSRMTQVPRTRQRGRWWPFSQPVTNWWHLAHRQAPDKLSTAIPIRLPPRSGSWVRSHWYWISPVMNVKTYVKNSAGV